MLASLTASHTKGRLVEIISKLILNTHQDRWFFREGIRDYGLDCFVAIHLSVTNNSVKPASVDRFVLEATWNETGYQAMESVVEGYGVIRRIVRPASGGDPINKFRKKWIPLEPFPLNEEITNTNYKTGWTSFYIGTLPPEASESNASEIKLKLVAYDHRNEHHTIYEGAVAPRYNEDSIVDLQTAKDQKEADPTAFL